MRWVGGYLNTARLLTFSDLISDHFDLLQDSTELSVQSRELRFRRFLRQFSIRNFPAGSVKFVFYVKKLHSTLLQQNTILDLLTTLLPLNIRSFHLTNPPF